jgi:hypothetical protein
LVLICERGSASDWLAKTALSRTSLLPLIRMCTSSTSGAASATSKLLRAKGYDVQTFTSSQSFLANHDSAVPSCVVIEARRAIAADPRQPFHRWSVGSRGLSIEPSSFAKGPLVYR